MTPRLSPRTKELVEIVFNPKDAAEASQWLEQEAADFGNHLDAHENWAKDVLGET